MKIFCGSFIATIGYFIHKIINENKAIRLLSFFIPILFIVENSYYFYLASNLFLIIALIYNIRFLYIKFYDIKKGTMETFRLFFRMIERILMSMFIIVNLILLLHEKFPFSVMIIYNFVYIIGLSIALYLFIFAILIIIKKKVQLYSFAVTFVGLAIAHVRLFWQLEHICVMGVLVGLILLTIFIELKINSR